MKPITLRLGTSSWTAIIGWAVLAVLILEPVVRGQWHVVLGYGPGVLLAAWLLFVLFWAPALKVTQDGAVMRNAFVTTRIPYPRIVDISVRLLVAITYTDNEGNEKKATSWNAPGMPKLGRSFSRESLNPIGTPAHARKTPNVSAADMFGPTQVLVDTWQNRVQDPDVPVTRRWHWESMVVTAVLLALVAWVIWG